MLKDVNNSYKYQWCVSMKMRLKEIAKRYIPAKLLCLLQKWRQMLWTLWGKVLFKNQINLRRNAKKSHRYLEIGCGGSRLPEFETLDIVGGPNVDYVYDAAKPLPFKDNTFDLIYASHVLEHIPWYKTEEVLREWVRILKAGGQLEVWVPDGLKICQTLLKAELEGINEIEKDGWYKFNPRKDPCVWTSSRIFTYGDGTGNPNHPNWHRAMFTPRYLKELFERVGLKDIREMDRSEVRGYDHGWINLGVKGTKP